MEPPWSGPMLLCLPGLGLDGAAWRPTLRALEDAQGDPWQHEVAPLPAYGARPRRTDNLRPAALGACLAADLDTGGLPRVLAGHSASCQIAAHAARIAPDRVAGLVLIGPTTDPRASSWPRLVARWLRTAVHERPGQVPLLLRTYTRIGLGWMLRAMEAARHDDITATLRGASCPVVVVRGHHDRICPADWAATVAGLGAPGSAAVSLAEGGHMVPLTHGADVAKVLRRWMV